MNNYILIKDYGYGKPVRHVVAIMTIPDTITSLPFGLSAVIVPPAGTEASSVYDLYQNIYTGDAHGVVEVTGDWRSDFQNPIANEVDPTFLGRG